MVHISESEGIEDRVFVVTGGAGFVGTKLCLELIRRGAREVRCFDIESSQSRLSYLRSNGVNCITGDVRHKEEVARAFKGVNCVFHLASYGISGKETLQARRIDEVNLDGTCNVLQSCIKCGVERLIYTSSYDVVFGGQEILNGNESLAYVPLMDHVSSYGRSKALAEQLVLKNNGQPLRGQKGRSLYTCAVRPAIVYGPGEQRLIPRIIKHARSGLFLFKIGASNVRTDWLYVDNFVQAQLLASMALLDDIPGRGGNVPAAGQTYFISDGSPVNFFEFLRPLIQELGYSFPSLELSLKASLVVGWIIWAVYGIFYPWLEKSWILEPLILPAEVYKIGVSHYFSPLKARKELGYVPLVDQKEAFKKTITYFKTRHAKDLESPSLLWLILILPIYFGLFPSVLVPTPFLGFLEPVRFPWIFLLRSVQNMQILVIIVCLGHLLEACFAWLLARQLDPINKKGWFLQTLFWGFPSFMLILKRNGRNDHRLD